MSLVARRVITAAACIVFGWLAFLLIPGCWFGEPQTEDTARAAVYGAELQKCIADAREVARTRDAFYALNRACRAHVACRWGRGPCPDAGGDR